MNREIEARKRFFHALGETSASLLIPAYYPVKTLVETTRECLRGKRDVHQAVPELVWGTVTALPSFASGTFVSPLILSAGASALRKQIPPVARLLKAVADNPLVDGLGRILVSKPFGRAYRLLTHPLVVFPLLVGSLIASGYRFFRNLADAADGVSSWTTCAWETATDLLFVGSGFLFAGFGPAPKVATIQWPHDGNVDLIFENPALSAYRGGLWDKLRGLRTLLLGNGPQALSGYVPANNDFRAASRLHREMDLRLLHRSGTLSLTVKGGYHLEEAAGEGTMILQHNHFDLKDWLATDLAARTLHVDHAQFIKANLGAIGVLKLLLDRRLGHHLMIADRNFENVRTMHSFFNAPYQKRDSSAVLEYLPWTRTSKNLMVHETGRFFTKGPRGLVESIGPLGPDSPKKIWRPHWEPFARAICYGRTYDADFRVVRSVMRQKNGAIEVEFFAPTPVRPSIDLMEKEGLTLQQAAIRFRDDDVEWIKKLVARDDFFVSYVDLYYRFSRGAVLGKGK